MGKLKIGYTTGVYDLFHTGHLNIIKNAYEVCDYLIVGVTSDETVFKLKGKYPIIPLAERKEIIKALKYVDEVVDEINTDKIEAWKKLKFDIIVKGDDWKGSKKWTDYEEQFAQVNVEVAYFPYTRKVSSTILREKIKNI